MFNFNFRIAIAVTALTRVYFKFGLRKQDVWDDIGIKL